MTAPAPSDVHQEVERFIRSLPDLAPRVEAVLAAQMKAEQDRTVLILEIAQKIRAADWLLEKIAALPPETTFDPPDTIEVLHAQRQEAFDRMVDINPEDAWAWEPKNLAAINRGKADLAAGRTTFYENGEAFEAAIAKIDAELEHSAHV